MIENINQNTKQTSRTLKIDGIAPINALTTTRMPSNLESAFNGLNARNVLMDLNAGISATPNQSNILPKTLTKTMKKSNQFQPLVK